MGGPTLHMAGLDAKHASTNLCTNCFARVAIADNINTLPFVWDSNPGIRRVFDTPSPQYPSSQTPKRSEQQANRFRSVAWALASGRPAERLESNALLIIARSGAKFRQLLNADAVEVRARAELPRVPVRRVDKESSGDVSFYQQMQSFHNAAIVISPHGSGLTNMIFMPP